MELQVVSEEGLKPPSGIPDVHVTSPAGNTLSRRRKLSGLSIFTGSLDRRLSNQSYNYASSPCSTIGSPTAYPPVNYQPSGRVTFWLQVTHLIVACLCTTLYALSLPHIFKQCQIYDMLSDALFPYVSFCTYVVVSAVTVLGSTLGHSLPPMLRRAFSCLGGAFFLTAAGVNFNRWMINWSSEDREAECIGSPSEELFASALLALLGAVLHWADMVHSLRTSLKEIEAIAPSGASYSHPSRRPSVVSSPGGSSA